MRYILKLPCCTTVLKICLLVCLAQSPAWSKPPKPVKDVVAKRKVVLRTRSWDDVRKHVRAQKGKVVVVNIWTSTCATCLEEFPKFVELQKEFGKKKVVCLSVNCDYDGIEGKPPEYYRKKVLGFLKKNKAEFDNTALNISFLGFLEKIDLSSTPAFLVYGRDGKLVKRFDNDNAKTVKEEFKFTDVETLVQRLTSKKSS